MMDLNSFFVADIETVGLLPDLKRGDSSQLHVLGVAYKSEDCWKIKTTNKEEDVKKLFENPNNTIAGHNFYMYDLPALERIYPDINIQATIIDTLWISWYIEPNRLTHGLEGYGEDFGVKKPEISSWTDLSYEEYEHRVTEDVKINTNLFLQQLHKLRELYENDEDRIKSLISFLMCKAKQYKMHQDYPLRIDLKKAEDYRIEIEGLIEDRCKILAKVMPDVKVVSEKFKPKTLFKKNGTLSVAGEKWGKLTEHYGKDITFDGPLEYVSKVKEPNPRSPQQVKDWLFSLGWKPNLYKESILKSGEINKVPQIKNKDGELCKSVLELAEKEPAIKELEDMGVLGHRLGIVKGFIKNSDDAGNIVADVGGTTNTARIKHRGLVNMPKPNLKYGHYARSLVMPQPGKKLIGADLSSLENMTRNNFIYPYDTDYVNSMFVPYYDSHLPIGVTSGLITKVESHFYKWWKEKRKNPNIKPEDIGELPDKYYETVSAYRTDESKEDWSEDIDKRRGKAKTVSYSALYGVGVTKLSKELGVKKSVAKKLLDAYWEINWSVKKFESSCKVKHVGKEKWVLNPLNDFWYSLRNEKDIFSTVNQSAGDYIFTMWNHFNMKSGIIIQAGFHDEIVTSEVENRCKEITDKLQSNIDKVNQFLNLKLPIGIDYKIGDRYSEVH